MLENFTLASLVIAAFGVEWKFYSWEQPQIVALENSRQEKIKAEIDRFLEAHGSNVQTPKFAGFLREFVNELSKEKNKDLVLPVGGYLSPHGRIFKWLLRALICSFCFGLFGMLADPSIGKHFHLSISDTVVFYIKLVLAILTSGPLCMAAWLGWDEFQYVLRIKELFKPLPSGSDILPANQAEALSHETTTKPADVSLQIKREEAQIREAERMARRRLKECVDILTTTADEPFALHQIRKLQKSLNLEREQVSVVRNDHFLIHACSDIEGKPTAWAWPDETSGGQSLYPAMKRERSGLKVARIAGHNKRVTAVGFKSLDNRNLMVVVEAHYHDGGV